MKLSCYIITDILFAQVNRKKNLINYSKNNLYANLTMINLIIVTMYIY